MKRSLAVLFLIAVCLAQASKADFRLVRRIPGPDGCGLGLSKITGLAPHPTQLGPVTLFVTSQCGAYMGRSFLHSVNPATGLVYTELEFDLVPPNCGAPGPYLSSGDFISGSQYWVTDECGEIMRIIWHATTLSIEDAYYIPGVDMPTGIVLRNDSLFVVDRESGVLHIISTAGELLDSFSLPFCCGASALAMHNGNLFVGMNSDSTKIYEITTAGALVDTHYVDGLAGMSPQSMAFVGGDLYVGGVTDSIRVFEFLESNVTPTAPGDSVTLDVVPGEVAVTFDSILDSGYVEALVYSAQPCPPPGGVEFFSEFYEVTTTSSLEYVNHLAFTDSSLADGTPVDAIRVFVRPSGGCGPWRDITTDFPEVLPTLKVNSRTRSEDDEFSVFVLGFDGRNQYDVVHDKYLDLRGHIISASDSIPSQAYTDMLNLLSGSAEDFAAGLYENAAGKAETVAEIAAVTTQIPHVYDPQEPGRNVAGRIIGRARTLAFSYRYYPVWLAGAGKAPVRGAPVISVGPNPTGGSVSIDLAPAGLERVEVAVYSAGGRKVSTLYSGAPGAAGVRLEWDGRNARGAGVAPGMYFVVARQGERTATAKVVIER